MAGYLAFYVSLSSTICRKAKEYLENQGIPYIELDVENDPAALESYKKLGVNILPVFELDGQLVAGFQPDRVQALANLIEKGPAGRAA